MGESKGMRDRFVKASVTEGVQIVLSQGRGVSFQGGVLVVE
jgi:hypothetical protein